MKTAVFWNVIKFVGVPIGLPAIAVAAGTLRPIFGVVAAVVLVSGQAIGQYVGRFLFSSVHKNGRGFSNWIIFGICAAILSGVGISTPLGVLGGTLFGVSLGALFVVIGYLESNRQKLRR